MFNVASMSPPVPVPDGFAGYQVLQDQRSELYNQFRKGELVQREVQRFEKQMQDVTEAKDVTEDYRTFNFMLNAYGLEDYNYANSLVEKALTENVNNDDAFANRIREPGFQKMAEEFQTYVLAKENGRTDEAQTILKGMSTRYVERMFEQSVGRNAPAVAQAMQFKRTIGEAEFMYDVIGNTKNYEVVRKAFQIPEQIVNKDIDQQEARLKRATSLDELKDPEEQDRLVRRFLAFSEVEPPSGVSPGQEFGTQSAATSILGGGTTTGSGASTAVQLLGANSGSGTSTASQLLGGSSSLLSATTLSGLNSSGF